MFKVKDTELIGKPKPCGRSLAVKNMQMHDRVQHLVSVMQLQIQGPPHDVAPLVHDGQELHDIQFWFITAQFLCLRLIAAQSFCLG